MRSHQKIFILATALFCLSLAHLSRAEESEASALREPAATKKKPSSKKKSAEKKSTPAKSDSKNIRVQESSAALSSGTPREDLSVSSEAPSSAINNSASKVDFNAKEVWNVDIFKDESHKVLVIQDRKYTKARKFEFGLDLGKMSASPFYKTYSYGGHLGYHFSEYFGIDSFFSAQTSSLSGDGKQIDQFLEARSFGAKKEFQKPTFLGGVGVMWSPIYGKFAFFRRSIIHFDVYGLAGLSVMTTESNVREFGGKNQTLPGSLLGVGTRVFLSKGWSLRIDMRNNLYKIYYAPPRGGDGGTKLLRAGFQFTLGASYLL